MNKILERQLKKHLPGYPEIPPEITRICEVVSDTYDDFDNDRKQIERSTLISSRELEEANIRQTESSHLLQSTIDAVESAIILTDEQMQLVAYNRRYAEMWHFPKELLEERDIMKLMSHVQEQLVDASGFQARSESILRDAQMKSTDTLHCKDGRIIERRSYPILISGGKHARVWVISDITELENAKRATINLLEDLEFEKNAVEAKVKERTKELITEHSRFQASTSSIPLGFLVFDKEQRVLIDNGVTSKLFNIEGNACTFEKIVNAIPRENFAEKFATCMTTLLPVEIKDVDVEHKILRILLTPMSTHDGGAELLGVVMLTEDTTEARTLERGRDEFFAIASHELRTPLTAIRGNMSIIEDYYAESVANEEVMAMIKDTNAAASRLITIVNDFLDVSRLEQGRIVLQLVDFSISGLVEEVIGELREVGMQKGIQLAVSCGVPSELRVHADYDRSKQVLTNLLSNAINYSEHGTVSVCVNAGDTHMEVAVRDEGVGIPPENLALLFRKFQQAGTSVLIRDMSQSTGLGLYISRLIVESMGGKIWLKHSIPGEGSEFAFTLPLARTPAI